MSATELDQPSNESSPPGKRAPDLLPAAGRSDEPVHIPASNGHSMSTREHRSSGASAHELRSSRPSIESGELRAPPPLAARLTVAIVSLLVVGGLVVALSQRLGEASAEMAEDATAREAAAEAAGQPTQIDVVRPVPSSYTPVIVLQGTLEPVQAADLGFEVAGTISRLDVALGERVERGRVLVALDRASVGAQSAQSEAAIQVAQANVEMLNDRVALLRQLTASGAAPTRELTSAEQQLSVAQAQLTQAQASRRSIQTMSADHVLRAPFDGVATRVPTGVGAVAGPGVTLVRVEDLSSLILRTTVSQSELEALAVGTPALIEGYEGVTGTIRSVVRSLDPETRRAPIEVLVANPEGRLVANALVRARIAVGGARPALRIPATARRSNGTVFVVAADNRVIEREVEAGNDLDGTWLVPVGLSAEDRVVVRPAAVREGEVVRPREAPAPAAQAEL